MNFSPIIAGVMRWGVWGADLSVAEVQLLVDACLSEGISTFDHADIYGGYTTEKLFGDATSGMNLPRENYQLISKFGIQYPGGLKPYELKSYNYSKEYILKCVDESLSNLRTDYLDLLLLHRPSPLMSAEEIAAAFGLLRECGKVKDFGVSNFTVSQFALIEQYFPDLVTNQVEISLNNTAAFYDGTLDQMMMRKIQPMAYSVLGNYFSQKTEQNARIKKVMDQLCETYNAEENQLLIAFLLKHPARIVPVVGTSKAENIRLFRKAVDINLSDDDWFKLLEAASGNKVP